MAALSTQAVVQAARQAGYQVALVERLRANRWLLTLTDTTGATVVLLVQARRRFSPEAQRTLLELADHRLQLCTLLPPAAEPMSGTAWQGNPALEPNQ